MSLSDLAYLIEEPDWMADAACRGLDSRIFFPKHAAHAEEAEATCGRCPVTEPCLEWALSFPSYYDHGIYAGTNANQRRAMRRQRGAA